MNFITENWQTIVAGFGGIIIVARVIVKLTPTQADDNFLSNVILPFLKSIGLHIKD